MANLKADSPVSRRIVLSFLDFLNSVEHTSGSDAENLEIAKDCLSEVFKIDKSSTFHVPNADSLVQIFSSQNNEIKSDQTHNLGSTKKKDTRTVDVEDELFGQFFGALEEAHYFGTRNNGDDEQAIDRATHLFHKALKEMKKSRCEEIDLKHLADTFKSQGNKTMQSKRYYSEAIELYTIAIALFDDNAIYYSNRAAAYTQTEEYKEAIADCLKAIEIDPNYSKAYSRLGFTYYAQGYYRDAIDNGFKKALQLDPDNENIKENIEAAEQKYREQQERYERERSSSSRRNIPPFTGIPTEITEPYDMSSMLEDMRSRRRAGNNVNGEPGIRVGDGPDDHMPEFLYNGLRSAMEMVRNERNSSNGRRN